MAKSKAKRKKAILSLKTPTILADGVIQFSTIVTSITLVFLTVGFYSVSNHANNLNKNLERITSQNSVNMSAGNYCDLAL
jgi:hypothetical protein